MRIRSLRFIFTVAVGLALLIPSAGNAWTTWQFRVLHRFAGGLDGQLPLASLITDARGNVYGTTAEGGGFCSLGGSGGCGTVFKLTPTAGGTSWTETIIHAFNGADGYAPSSALIEDPAGALYGTTPLGGSAGAGVVFQLVRTGPNTYKENILYTFSGGLDGAGPDGGLYQDARGNVYGETSGGGLGFGTIFKLAAPAAGSTVWTPSTLYAFTDTNGDGSVPAGGLIGGRYGVLYGVTNKGGAPNASSNGYGTVFTLSPPAPGTTEWTERVIYAFRSNATGKHPTGPLLFDRNGYIVGLTPLGGTAYLGCGVNGNGIPNTGCGTAFALTPPTNGSRAWTEHILFAFGSFLGYLTFGPYEPSGSLVEDSRGQLYGTTTGGGTNGSGGYGDVFRLTPPAGGGFTYTQTTIESFNAAKGDDGSVPAAGLHATAHALFGTTEQGGLGGGTVFELIAH